jgi:glycosyltransferase involved in cell wall biosynthesis
MYRGHTVGVVMPAYNEEGFVGDVIREMPAFVDRMYVIDDRSTDGTWEEILEAARRDAEEHAFDRESAETTVLPDGGTSALSERAIVHERIGRVVPIEHRENLGAGGAIKTGYLAARDTMDAAVTVDADGQMDLSQMSRLLDPLVNGDADYAKGNRLLSSEYRAAMPRFRLFGNTILTFLTKIASGYWKTMDPQNGYTAISGDALERVDVEGLYEYYGYCNELLIKLNANELRVADVAMPAVYGDEESSIKYSEYVPKVSAMLLRSFLWRLRTRYLARDFNPLALFYVFGAGLSGIGLLAGAGSMISAAAGGTSPVITALLSLLVFSVGCFALLFAMHQDMAENRSKEIQIA